MDGQNPKRHRPQRNYRLADTLNALFSILQIRLAIAYRAVGQDTYMDQIGQIASITLAVAQVYIHHYVLNHWPGPSIGWPKP